MPTILVPVRMDDPANMIRRVNRARNFPTNTCSSSRHVQMIGEALIRGKPYLMIEEEPEHVGGSLLAVVEALYKARTEIDRLRAKLGMPSRCEEALARFEREQARRVPLSREAQDARRPQAPMLLLEAEQDHPDVPAKARTVRAKRLRHHPTSKEG